MSEPSTAPKVFFAFHGSDLLARGDLTSVARSVRRAEKEEACEKRLALFQESSGAPIDIDTSGSEAEMFVRLAARFPLEFGGEEEGSPQEKNGASVAHEPSPRGRGRPRLGVVSREISLLPRHWAWLAEQEGGASATLRRLVDQARKATAKEATTKAVVNALYRFLSDLAGDFPHFEESSRALFAQDWDRLLGLIECWPHDVVEQVARYIEQARSSAGAA